MLYQYSNGDPLTGRRMQEVCENCDFRPVYLYLRNDTRYGHSYYETPIETRKNWIRCVERCRFQ